MAGRAFAGQNSEGEGRVNPETERRAVAFIRTIGNRCTTCLRRSAENCRGCISAWANSILRDIENETKPEIDYSLSARMMMIIDALGKADAPLLSSEIDMKQCCTKQLKRWTLLKMMRMGYIVRTRPRVGCSRRFYRYALNRDKRFPVSAGTMKN